MNWVSENIIKTKERFHVFASFNRGIHEFAVSRKLKIPLSRRPNVNEIHTGSRRSELYCWISLKNETKGRYLKNSKYGVGFVNGIRVRLQKRSKCRSYSPQEYVSIILIMAEQNTLVIVMQQVTIETEVSPPKTSYILSLNASWAPWLRI